MINRQLLEPGSIVVVGGSNNLQKPGGKIIQNILRDGYGGNLYAVNPTKDVIQGVPSFRNIEELPSVELAILVIAAPLCKEVMQKLAEQKHTSAFIVLSAGFSEEGEEGKKLELELAEVADKSGSCLIGPNCIGVVTQTYSGVFTTPVPRLSSKGCDFVSGSGAVAVFIIESAMQKGLTFSSMYSVGNSAQTGIEEVLEYWDNHYAEGVSSPIKLIYLESIRDPDKLLHHASCLIRKGCKIAAIKAGTTEEGIRAAVSHTGAITSADSAVEALFRKAGIVRCFGREELTTVASVFTQKQMKGKNMAIITHAGGPAVMLTDALSAGGLKIPTIPQDKQEGLLSLMNPGASAQNPIDLIATGNIEQLGKVIDYADKQLPFIDGMSVIFGSNGLIDIAEIYDLLHRKINECVKPIYPILPSVTSTAKELGDFVNKGHVCYSDEVVLGHALTKIHNTPYPAEEKIFLEGIDVQRIRQTIASAPNGFAEPRLIRRFLEIAGIPVVREGLSTSKRKLIALATEIGYPLVIKAVGPVHKSEIGGVTLNIKSQEHLLAEYKRMRRIKGVKSVLIQPMLTGTELFVGAMYESRFGHVIMVGLGGIFVEVLGDFSSGLAPLTFNEADSMIRSLKSYRIIRGTRGKKGVDEKKLAEIIVRLSSLLRFATEIKEVDLNPLVGDPDHITVVDARMRIEK
ncbi:MAG: acetate--CoA ligase family protein [Bacteroidales bacterium]|nr:acetate--CoA ligase family protein [Bacteroidales bacterium]